MSKQPNGWRKGYTYILVGYMICIILLYWIAHEQIYRLTERTTSVSVQTATGQLSDGAVVIQPYTPKKPLVLAVDLYMGALGMVNDGVTRVALLEGERVLGEASINNAQVQKDDWYTLAFSSPVQVISGKPLNLQVIASGVSTGQGITLFGGVGMDLGRGSVSVETTSFMVSGKVMQGELCFRVTEQVPLMAGQFYWPVTGAVGLLLGALFLTLAFKERKGENSFILRYITLFHQYSFLVDQLVRRDFKVKYKRSFLGVLWSFLNPLLTMAVQYIVFSTIFRNDIENFPVYLMTGIVLFNFFSESVGLGLGSIVNNASLINKVYVPKYIYPITRVLSSAINLMISLIPLLGMMAVMGVPFTKALLLMPLVILLLLVFCIGMSLLLSTCMVFFRDTQFLWGIISLLWVYLTPIFYPESIIPEVLLKFFHLNPMYQFIYFMRSITLSGISPSPISYLYCMLAALVPLLLGLCVFKRHQDKFVLYL